MKFGAWLNRYGFLLVAASAGYLALHAYQKDHNTASILFLILSVSSLILGIFYLGIDAERSRRAGIPPAPIPRRSIFTNKQQLKVIKGGKHGSKRKI